MLAEDRAQQVEQCVRAVVTETGEDLGERGAGTEPEMFASAEGQRDMEKLGEDGRFGCPGRRLG